MKEKPNVILYVGKLLTYDYILAKLKVHAPLVGSATVIDPDKYDETRVDHADLVIFEDDSMIDKYETKISHCVENVLRASILAKKGISTLLLGRCERSIHHVHEISAGRLDLVAKIGTIYYHYDNDQTLPPYSFPHPNARFFDTMDWADFEKKCIRGDFS